MNTLRWIFFIPIGAFVSFFFGGVLLKLGSYVVGHWTIGSGLLLFFASCAIPTVWMLAGLKIAPSRKNLAKWLLLTPLFVLSLSNVIFLFMMFFRDLQIEDIFGHDFALNLSPRWQAYLFFGGFVGTTFLLASKSVSELEN